MKGNEFLSRGDPPHHATVPTNAPGWWRIIVEDELPATTDADTTISGQQFDLADPTVGLDVNRVDPVAARTVGTAAISIRQVDAPELELWGTGREIRTWSGCVCEPNAVGWTTWRSSGLLAIGGAGSNSIESRRGRW